jgi:UDP-glucose 4-epimerase
MRVLVSGGAGYIGSVTTATLIEQGYDVVVFDNLRQGHTHAVHPQAVFVEGDLLDQAALEAVFTEHGPFDGIMNFASHTLVGESMQHPELYLRDSVSAGINLLAAAQRHGVKAFILSSTANLFDDPETIPIAETERIVPGSPYGEMKWWMERALYWYDRNFGLRYGALRYFNACGCTETIGEHHDPETHLIPLVLQVALGQRESISIFGDDYPTRDGTCVRDYVHVSDLAAAHILTLEALIAGGASRRYNLGNGAGFTVKEVIEAARTITGHAIPARVVERRAGDPATLIASSETIRRELGWTPRYATIESIIETAWNWHKDHPHGYAD